MRANNKRHEIIRGPLGAGKTLATAFKVLRRICQQKPEYPRDESGAVVPGVPGIRRSRVAIIRNCFDDETDILTEQRGWQRFVDLKANDKVAMLRHGELIFTLPTYYYAAPYQGDMVCHQSENTDFCVTPDHRMYVSKCTTRQKVWGEYGFALAKDIEGRSNFKIKRDANWTGQNNKLTEDFFEWLGFWFAEGNVGKTITSDGYVRRRLIVTQCRMRGIAYARDLFARAGIKCAESLRMDGGTCFRVCTHVHQDTLGNRLFELLKDCGLQTVRGIPNWIKNGTPEQLQAFITGFMLGDGWRGHVDVAFTSSRRLANDLQEIALKAGLVANINVRDRIGQLMTINGAVSAPTALGYSVTFMKSRGIAPWLSGDGWSRKKYDGTVYCVEVPTHVVYVRRNGRAMWCSQTYPDLTSTTIRDWKRIVPSSCGNLTMGHPPEHKLDFDLPDGTRVEAEVLFVALDHDDHVRKLRGLQLTFAWYNEMKEIQKAIFDMVDGRIDRYPAPGASAWVGTIGDTNAWDQDHWLADIDSRTQLGEFKNYEFFVQPPGVIKIEGEWRVNPLAENLEVLKSDYYANQIEGKSQDWIKVNLANEIGTSFDGKAVHPDYSDSTHGTTLLLDPPVGGTVRVGCDWGLTPAAAYMWQDAHGVWNVFDECVATEMGAEKFADQLKISCAKYPQVTNWIFRGDPSGDDRKDTDERSVIQVMAANGIMVIAASTNDPVIRRGALERPLRRMISGRPAIRFSPRCKILRKGLAGGFCYRRVRIAGYERFRNEPDKNEYSHIVEGCEYALMDGGEHSVVNAKNSINFPKGPVKPVNRDWNPFDD